MSHVDQQNQAVGKTKGCSLSPEKDPLLKITSTHSLNMENFDEWLHGAFTSTFWCLCNAKGLLMHRTLKEKPRIHHKHKTLDLQPVVHTKCC